MPIAIADLSAQLKSRLNKFTFDVVDEVSKSHDGTFVRYDSANPNWTGGEVVKVIDQMGNQTISPASSYTVNLPGGYISFTSPQLAVNTIWLDYSFFPFTDAQLTAMVQSGLVNIKTLIYRPVPVDNVPEAYVEAILKKAFTIAMREMQFPTIKYFTISIGGRSMGKENQVEMINKLIESNEEELLKDVNAIRYHDKTNVLI